MSADSAMDFSPSGDGHRAGRSGVLAGTHHPEATASPAPLAAGRSPKPSRVLAACQIFWPIRSRSGAIVTKL